MTYKTPGVSVYQVLTKVSQALADCQLLPCLVGPLKQVVKNSALSISLPVSTTTNVAYPNIKVGAIVDTSSVKIKVSNGVNGIYKIKYDDIITAMIISNDEVMFYDNDKKLVHIVCFSKGNIILSSEIVYKKLINSDDFESTSKDDVISFKIMK